MTVPCAVLMCHAPIVIPAIAGARGARCARTTSAMREAASRLLRHAPDVIAIVSPHAPRDRVRFGVTTADTLAGDFSRFGVPEIELRAAGAPEAASLLREKARERGLETFELSGSGLDHGTLVPLYFLCEAGWRGRTLVLSLPYPNTRREPAMGGAIAETARALDARFCVLASGDMSHRLTPDAPEGYHPRGGEFDRQFRERVAAGDLLGAIGLDRGLRETAAEDVVDSCAVAAGAVDFETRGHRVLSYEGPFGVGYLEAVLCEHDLPREAPQRDPDATEETEAQLPRELLTIARRAIAAQLGAEEEDEPPPAVPLLPSRGVFVTLRLADGSLRGCIGHLEPTHALLSDEVAACARAAATRDVRFPPLRASELAHTRIEISVLSRPELITGPAELDPLRYGVVVSAGDARGVLLPNIDGIHDAREQIRIAARKAGLSGDAVLTLHRFRVTKLVEERPSHAHEGLDREVHRELN